MVIFEHDSNYNTTFLTRGNVTTSVTPAGTRTMAYDIGGNLLTHNNNGLTTSATLNSTTNYAAPVTITTNSLSSNMSWSSFLGLSTSAGPNQDTLSVGYDTSARPHTTTSPLGATTTYTYNDSASPPTKVAITADTASSHWVRTTMDGLGRTIKTETGNGTTTLMLENGADIRVIQEMLGHAKLTTTELYTRVSINLLKQVYAATHPAASLKPRQAETRDMEAEAELLAALAAEAEEEL